MTEENIIHLTAEEIETTKIYQESVESEKASLGMLRQNYLIAERKAIEALGKANTDYISYIKALAEGKNLPADQEWFFDPVGFSFKRREGSE